MEGNIQKQKWPFSLKAGLSVISLCILISIFAYLIIPDKSTNSNFQIPEIALKNSGYHCLIYKESIGKNTLSNNWISNLILGQDPSWRAIPYDSFQYDEDRISFFTPLGTTKVVKHHLDRQKVPQYIADNTVKKYYLLGTDKFGRDLLSRLILGIRVSLLAGLIAVAVSLMIGLVLGCFAGYYGGWIDQLVMFIINVMWSLPTILMVFAIVLTFGRGMTVIYLAIGLTMWVDVARIARGQVMAIKEEQFIMAAKSIGQRPVIILLKHILPNIVGPILVVLAANFATAILVEAGLSYLGFGVNPPIPSLGNILNENYGFALSGYFTLAIMPAFLIMVLVLSFNLIGTGLRDLFDIK